MKNKIPYDGPKGFSLQGYYNSVDWFNKATAIKKMSRYKCYRCGSKKKMRVHHKTYKNIPNELPEDLVVLCKWCHETVHKFGIQEITILPNEFIPTKSKFDNYEFWNDALKVSGEPLTYEDMELYLDHLEEMRDEREFWNEIYFGNEYE